MRGNPKGGELDVVEVVCRCYKKNSTFVLSYICKRIREGCDCGSKVGTFHN